MVIFNFSIYFMILDCLLVIDIIESTFAPSIAFIYIFYFIIYCFFLALLGLLLWIFRIKITYNFKFIDGYLMSLYIFLVGYSRVISELIGVLLRKVRFFVIWCLLYNLGIILRGFGLVLEVFKAWGRLRDVGLVDYDLVSRRTNRNLLLYLNLALLLVWTFLFDLLSVGLIILKDE